MENFGKSGALPTHPELLDWLALQLVEQGWCSKAIHRLIMTSSAYRQSSHVAPDAERLDPGNQLLSRMPLTRLDAEALRDSILHIAGSLDETPYGPPELLYLRHDGMVLTPDFAASQRRSIYLQQRRATVHTMLDQFDYPQMGPNCSQRRNTTVVTQALFLLNDKLIQSSADKIAQRLLNEAGDRREDQIDRLYWLALSRPPTDEEKSILLEELRSGDEQGADELDWSKLVTARLCHALINATPFVHVE
jgi:hypothetical protein